MTHPDRSFRFVFVVLIVAALMLLFLVPQESVQARSTFVRVPAPAAPGREIQVESLLNPDGTFPIPKGLSGELDVQGWDLTLDPKRGPVASRGNAAPTAGESWGALPNGGLKGNGAYVKALEVYNGALYVGGSFLLSVDNSLTLGNIAKFDGTNWSALPNNGLNEEVTSFAVYGGNLYVGGLFDKTGAPTITLNHIAKYNGTSWAYLSNSGLNGNVYALEVYDGDLVIGGDFSATAGVFVAGLGNIAKYNGTVSTALPNGGLNSDVYAMKAAGFALYVGGDFTASATGGVTLNKIAALGDNEWLAMANNGLDGDALALAANNSTFGLYVGGGFNGTISDGITLYRIAFDDGEWHALPNNGLNGAVYSIMMTGDDIYVGGSFLKTFDNSVTLNRIAMFDGTNWSALPNNGLNNEVRSLSVWGTRMFVGGLFAESADGNVTGLNAIAKMSFASTQTGPTYVVNTNADTDDGLCDLVGQGHGNQDCTLREAVDDANVSGDTATIHFSGDMTIMLGSTLPGITEDATIDGETHKVVLDGGNAHRILVVNTTAVNVNHLTLRNGLADTNLAYGKSGAAIYNDGGLLTIDNSTFENNDADAYGGAILADGLTNITNSSFSANSADAFGGGVIGLGTLAIKNSTFSQNNAPSGAGVYSQGTLTLINTILANSTGPDCGNGGTIASAKNNLIESTGASACGLTNGVNGNKIGVDPNLATPGDNGGVTNTFALNLGSPARDAGDNATCAAAPVSNKDQRGSTRPLDGEGNGSAICDMGAFEAATVNTPTATRTLTRTVTPTVTRTRTSTSVPATNTHTPTSMRTNTPTATRTSTPGNGPTNTHTATSTATTCSTKPGKPTLLKPANTATVTAGKVKLKWSAAACATSYQVIIKQMATGQTVFKQTVTAANAKMAVLPAGNYEWFVKAQNPIGVTKSGKFPFIR